MTLAQHTAAALDASGAPCWRAPQDLSKYGLAWSQIGLDRHRDGARWRVVQSECLRQCAPASHRQGLGEFFLDDLHEIQIGSWCRSRNCYRRSCRPCCATTHRPRLHTSAACSPYPWRSAEQSNQWAIETLAMAQSPEAAVHARTRPGLAEVQRLRAHHAASERLHPAGARATATTSPSTTIRTRSAFSTYRASVTVDSVFAWLNRSGLRAGGANLVR